MIYKTIEIDVFDFFSLKLIIAFIKTSALAKGEG